MKAFASAIPANPGTCGQVDNNHERRRRGRRANILVGLILAMISISSCLMAQSAKKPAQRPGDATKGTSQLAGGDCLIGTTYTFTDRNGGDLNAKIASIEYSVTRFNIDAGTVVVPKAGEKLIILHWVIKNPNKSDHYVGRNVLPYCTVAADGVTRDHNDYWRLSSAKTAVELTLKPGQGAPAELLSVGIVPAEGAVAKLIIKWGRVATNDKVSRFVFGKSPNVIKALAAGDADPADPTGATARAQISAAIGTLYPLGNYDFTIDSISYVPGPIGKETAGDGKRFLVVTLSATNRTWHKIYTSDLIDASLTTADDEKTKSFLFLKAKRDERFEGRMTDPDEKVSCRMAFVVPQDTTGKKLTIAEGEDNSGHVSRALVFDLSSIK